jgi:hypothetical protein
MTEIDNGTIVRYCKPSTLDEQRRPSASSFALRTHINEKELSIHLLDYFNNPSEKEKIKAVKEWQKNFNFNTNALFATLDIKESQDYVFNKISKKISYVEMSLPHCGILFPKNYNELVISELLSQCVKNTYPVKEV